MSVEKREFALNLGGRTVNSRRPERARTEGSTGPKRLDDTRCKSETGCDSVWAGSDLLVLVDRRGGLGHVDPERQEVLHLCENGPLRAVSQLGFRTVE